MRPPGDLSGADFAESLRGHFGYRFVRQRGSHISLAVKVSDTEHHITIPRHRQIRVGTLSSIVSSVAEQIGASRDEVRSRLFER